MFDGMLLIVDVTRSVLQSFFFIGAAAFFVLLVDIILSSLIFWRRC